MHCNEDDLRARREITNSKQHDEFSRNLCILVMVMMVMMVMVTLVMMMMIGLVFRMMEIQSCHDDDGCYGRW